MSIVRHERETYEQMWSIGSYGEVSPGERYVDAFLDMAQPHPGAHVLDAGCGTGKGALALVPRGFRVTLCDLTPDGLLPEARALPFRQVCLWHGLRGRVDPVDWVYCCDVLEHVPPVFTMLAVVRLLEVARRGAFLSIALDPDRFGAWVGTPLHQTVQSFVAWRDQLAEVGRVCECRDLGSAGLYLVTHD